MLCIVKFRIRGTDQEFYCMQIARLAIAGAAVGFWFAMQAASQKIDEESINYHWQLCGYIYANLAFYGTLICFVLPDFAAAWVYIVFVITPFILFVTITLHILKCVEFNDNPSIPYKVYNLGQWVEFSDSPPILCTAQYCTTYLYDNALCVMNTSDLDDVYVVGVLNYNVCRTRGTYTIDGFVFVAVVTGLYAVTETIIGILFTWKWLCNLYWTYYKK